ncbi:TRAP transporter small permease [Desulfobacula sp.]|uniref:TRAP transporter small permease n=1 Tax=Desulfobacula sp. TaxID=2593537 RepID=UPI002623DD48|nr:TRAP transporter small permease [Desulfobacula sp.]
MKIIISLIHFIEKKGLFLIFSTMLIALTISMLTRYVFQRPLSWTDELSTYLFIVMTFLAASASIKTGTELKVDVLYERFPQWRKGLDLILHSVRLLVSVFFIVYGLLYVQVEIVMDIYSPILQIPLYLIYCTLPIFGLLMAIRTIDCLIILFKGE